MPNISKAEEESKASGIYRGVDFDTYASWTPVNASRLDGFSRTPKHVYYEMLHGGKERTPALDLGHLVHMAVLEPERFEKKVAAAPRVDKRTKAGKQAFAEFEAAHAECLIVTDDMCTKAKVMAAAVLEHPTAREYFVTNKGENEISFIWEDVESGVRCKGRVDRVSTIGEWPIVGELKTARNASRREMEKAVYNFGYHVQAAHYLNGLETLYPIPDGQLVPFRRFVFFVVESEPPFACAVYEIDDSALAEGYSLRAKYLEQWRECVEAGRWPGYPEGIEYLGLPAWAYKIFQE